MKKFIEDLWDVRNIVPTFVMFISLNCLINLVYCHKETIFIANNTSKIIEVQGYEKFSKLLKNNRVTFFEMFFKIHYNAAYYSGDLNLFRETQLKLSK